MIELILYQFLSERLSLPVYTQIPKTPPQSYYALEKTGGALSNHISSSTVAIKSVGTSLYDAALMNEELKRVMLYELVSLPEIASVELNSDYNFTDSQTKINRYQAVFDIVHY